MHINFQHLMYFREIALSSSVTKASQRLNIAQPALSIQLKRFEEALGTQLFRREGMRLLLTPIGEEVLRLSHQVHASGQRLRELATSNTLQRHLKFGSLDNIPKVFVADLAIRLKEKADAMVSVIEGDLELLLRELVAGSIEFVVTEFPVRQVAGKKLASVSLAKKQVGVFGVKRFLKLKKGFPQSLDQVPVILPTEHSRLKSEIDHFFVASGINPKVVFESQDTMVQKMLALKGEGVVFLPYHESEIGILEDLHLIAEVPELESEFFAVSLTSDRNLRELSLLLKGPGSV